MTVHAQRERVLPDDGGHFGSYGGRFVPETLMGAIEELEREYEAVRRDESFQSELQGLLQHFVGRPTPLYFAERLTAELGGAAIYLKREDLAHTGAHKINNALAQGLLAKRVGKPRIIAETGAGQHGVATATACALLDLDCVVYMGEKDIARQSLNVFRMRLLGAEVRPVGSGSRTLKDAINETIRDWVTNVETTHYIIGSVVGPHPYPMMVRDFQAVIGREAREQMIERTGAAAGLRGGLCGRRQQRHRTLPRVRRRREREADRRRGGGPRRRDGAARLHPDGGPAGSAPRKHVLPAPGRRRPDPRAPQHLGGPGLPGVGPEHSYLKDTERAVYVNVSDDEALEGFKLLSTKEGIIPALEPAHAIYHVSRLAPSLPRDQTILVGLSGRGDKDMGTVAEALGVTL